MLKCAALFCALMAVHAVGFAAENSGETGGRFEGRVQAALTRDRQMEGVLYTIGTNFLRVESTATNAPGPVNILNRRSGELILVFPHNSSFVRLKTATHSAQSPEPRGMPQMPPGIPPGMGMPPMPSMAMEKLELRDLNEKTNILGYACEHFQMQQRGKILDIWATSQLGAFQPYWRSQPPSVRASTIEEQWADLLQGKRLFPLLATLKLENGLERLRFEVTSIASQRIADENNELFQPPAGYHETLPLPF